MLLPRLQHAWNSMAPITKLMKKSPTDAVQELFFDDLVYDAPAISNLIRLYGKSQVMLGTDYPFPILDRDPVGRLTPLGLDEESTEMLFHANAARWLGTPASLTD